MKKDAPAPIAYIALNLRELRAVAEGRLPRRVRTYARLNLVWFDEGPAAGLEAEASHRKQKRR